MDVELKLIGRHVHTRDYEYLEGVGAVPTDNGVCTWGCKVLCWFGLHRWNYPGGYCECCGLDDNL